MTKLANVLSLRVWICTAFYWTYTRSGSKSAHTNLFCNRYNWPAYRFSYWVLCVCVCVCMVLSCVCIQTTIAMVLLFGKVLNFSFFFGYSKKLLTLIGNTEESFSGFIVCCYFFGDFLPVSMFSCILFLWENSLAATTTTNLCLYKIIHFTFPHFLFSSLFVTFLHRKTEGRTKKRS